MTDFKAADRDVSRAIRSWLHEDRHEDASRIAGAVLDQVEATPRHRATWWPVRRTPTMNRFITFGLGAAAMVALLMVGAQLFDSPTGGVGGPSDATATPEPTATLEPSIAEPSPSLPSITVTIPASGWTCDASLPEGPFAWFDPTVLSEPNTYAGCPLSKGENDQGDLWMSGDLPESALLAMATTAGIVVYEDPCQWEYLVPDPPATTADQIAAALAAQPSRDASDPVEVTVGGYPGLEVTLHVPDDLRHVEDGSFTDCFRGIYASYTPVGWGAEAGASLPGRVHQGPGQIDTFWIVDVDGAIVIINAMYRADTPAERIEEMRAIAESATFELP